MNILFVANDKKGPGFYRMMVPCNEIRKANLAGVRLVFGATQEDVMWADIVVIQLGYHPSLFEMFDWARSIGKIIVYEIDDYLQGVNPSNPSYTYWNPAGPHLQRALTLMQKADAMTVTTKQLQREYAPWNPQIHVLPNMLDKQMWAKPNTKHKDKRVRIGFMGGANHQQNLELVDDVMTRICNKHPDVLFQVMGILPERAFKKIPQADIRVGRKVRKQQLETFSPADITIYPLRLADIGFDIGIAPLVDNAFNRCRSDLRIREYAALGIPVVASDVGAYSESVQDKKTGFLVKEAKDWVNALDKLITDKTLRQKMSDNQVKWANENIWIQDHVAQWVTTYEHIRENVLRKAGLLPQ